MRTLISVISEKNLNTLQTIEHFEIEKVILLITKESKQKKWEDGLLKTIKTYHNLSIELVSMESDSQDSINFFYSELESLIQREVKIGNEIILGIGTGLRQHSLLFWGAFLSMPDLPLKFVSPDQKYFQMESWQIIHNEVNYSKSKFKKSLSFKTILNINGYLILNANSIVFQNDKLIPDNFNTIITNLNKSNSKGFNFEALIYSDVFELLRNSNFSKYIAEVYFGVKIQHETNSNKCEYDIIMVDKFQRILIFECKAGNATKKDFEAQKELAGKWGGRFVTFLAVKSYDRSNFKIIASNMKSLNFKTIFTNRVSSVVPEEFRLEMVLKEVLTKNQFEHST